MPVEASVLRKQFEAYLNATIAIREENEQSRDYFDGYQWTDEEVNELQSRGQAAVVNNRIKPKIEALQELERQSRTDPKAFPRTPAHEEQAEAATDAIRFVVDNNDADQIFSKCFEYLSVEGTEAAIVEVEERGGEPWISLKKVHWDRYYYDPHSREDDFSDANYDGIGLWMDQDDADRAFPGNDFDTIIAAGDPTGTETLDDRPSHWVDQDRKRVRICQHMYQEDGEWWFAFFTGEHILRKDGKKMQGVSPFVDEFGTPLNPIIKRSAYVDRQNQRYGHVRLLKDLQDEVNHRASKFLAMLSHRTIIADAGAVDDAHHALRELAKPRGYIEVNPGAERFDIDNHADMGQAQFAMLEHAKEEIDGKGPNEGLQGQGPAESGRARLARQGAGLLELGTLFDRHRSFKREIYRHVWYRVKQFWTEERFVRITDDQSKLEFVALNQTMTKRMRVEEVIGFVPPEAEDDPRIDDPFLDPQGQPIVKNDVTDMDMDIILAETPDVLTIQQEQFQIIAQLAQAYPEQIPFELVLELSSLRDKEKVLEQIKGDEQQQAALAQVALQDRQMEQVKEQTELQETAGKAAKLRAETLQIMANLQPDAAVTGR